MNPTKKFLSLVAAVGLVLGIGAGGATLVERVDTAPVQAAVFAQEEDVIVSGAVIRFGENGPYYHLNENHSAIGLIDTTVQPFINASGWLEITLKDVPGTKSVASITFASDETLTARGVICGGSGGVNEIRFRCSKPSESNPGTQVPLNLNLAGHYDNLEGDNSNGWITVVHEIKAAN